MIDKNVVIAQIREAFSGSEFPGDAFLQGSHEGCEPAEVIAPFKGLVDWQVVDPTLLDAHYDALSFFSEAGFRFFLPAYLIADLRGQLQTAEPVFHLTHGFYESSVKLTTSTGVVEKKLGKHVLLNPRRYGAMTFYDYARFRLSIFTREEARTIVVYLRYKQESDSHKLYQEEIDAALASFWLDRATNAPQQHDLRQHREAEERYLREICNR